MELLTIIPSFRPFQQGKNAGNLNYHDHQCEQLREERFSINNLKCLSIKHLPNEILCSGMQPPFLNTFHNCCRERKDEPICKEATGKTIFF